MTLQEYALGQAKTPETLSRWIERQTPHMGSFRGGSARNLIIYKRRDRPGWHFPSQYDNEEQAWTEIQQGFVQAFELAGQGRWEEIDEIEALQSGPGLVVKLLYVYFPDEILPICSRDHLRRFLRLAGDEQSAAEESLGSVQLNRALLDALRGIPELSQLPTKGIERFLYRRFSPLRPELYKIAPGHRAMYWEDCLAGGYICVGWDEMGDLRQYDSKEAFLEAFHEHFDYDQAKATVKSNELWTLMEIEEGHLIAANEGISKILAVGKVLEPGYVWDEGRTKFKHTLRVDWDTSFAQDIPPQGRWRFLTIARIQGKLRETILSMNGQDLGSEAVGAEPLFQQIAESLERRGQAILYGPPGTGKTWSARRFAQWWLRQRNGAAPDMATDGTGPTASLAWVTFHPSYSYEDFVEGFRPVSHEGVVQLELEDGIFKRRCEQAKENPDRTYLLVIDEINRANIAKVFGELITLIEKDKRGDLEVTLPYSKERFTIPPNLFMLGTMNTADRSIRLLDTALRRRFGFIELMPRIDLLEGASVEGLALDVFLNRLNDAIAKGVGREKQVGHSYFLDNEQPVTDAAQFARIFKQEIIPLLQEYALDDYEVLADYVGEGIVDRGAKRLNAAILDTPEALLEALEDSFGPGPTDA